MERARLMLVKHKSRLMKYENVIGVGLGYKTVSQKTTGEPAVVVLVEKKLPAEMLRKRQVLPRALAQDVPTDVIEVGTPRLLASRTEHMRPALPGVSIGHYKITAGTFGALVYDKNTGEALVLSNNHVLANVTDGRDGRAKKGDPIYQPGPYDGGTEKDIIARLERFVPVYCDRKPAACPVAGLAESVLNRVIKLFKPDYAVRMYKHDSRENTVDAALAKPISDEAVKAEVLELGSIKGTAEARPGLRVAKSGRSSGVTRGLVQAVDVTLRVMMDEGEFAVFSGQLVTDPLAQPGDSGSIVLDSENRAVGLLFAGSDKASIVTPIERVLEQLNIRL